jgi:hypothetical protein
VPLLVLFLLVFFALLALLAFVAWKLFSTKDAQGNRTTQGCLLGIVSALSLGCLGVLALGAFIAAAIAISTAKAAREFAESTEGFKVGIVRDAQERIRHDEQRTLHVLLEWNQDADPDEEFVHEVRELCRSMDATVEAREEFDDAGRPVHVMDIAVPIDPTTLDEIERELARKLPEYSREHGIQFEYLGVRLDEERREHESGVDDDHHGEDGDSEGEIR